MAKRSAKKAVKRSSAPKRVHPLKRHVPQLTSLTIIFWMLIGILFLAIYLTQYA